MKKITEKITRFIENFKNVHAEARKIGFAGVMRLLWKDLFVGRSLFQWLYLIALSSVPLILEFTQNTESHDWIGLLASWTGIVCVILVAEGRASIYLWWGENIHIQGMYWVYTLNSLVGWYQWTKAVKEG